MRKSQSVVLIAEDEPDIRSSLRDALEAFLAVRCVLAESGTHALEALDAEVDLIVSDFKMPGLTGVEFLRQARRRFPRVPRILITAFADLDVAINAINEAHVDAFLVKPVDPVQLIEQVRNALAAANKPA